MRYMLVALVALLLPSVGHAQRPGMFTEGYRIEVRLTDRANEDVVLGHHFGSRQYVVDTVWVGDDGVAVFEAQGDTLRYGVYFVYVPDVTYFDFLVAEPEVVLETSAGNALGDMEVIQSEENRLFFTYLKYVADRRTEAQELGRRLEAAGPDEGADLRAQLTAMNEADKAWLADFRQRHAGTLTSSVIGVNQDVRIPDPPESVDDERAWYYRYYYDNYWQHTDLSDERLLYSPWLEDKLTRYVTELTVQHPDSVALTAERVVALTDGNPEMFLYVVNWITNHYEFNNLMLSESVWVHMVDTYYSDDQAWWMNTASLDRMRERADALRPVLIGKEIPNLVIDDFQGRSRDLLQSDARYTVLYFYRPDCGYCRDSAPVMEEQRVALSGNGVEFWGVALGLEDGDSGRQQWEAFIDEFGLQEWVHVADPERDRSIATRYDVRTTPATFVVDQDKNIIFRRLAAEQIGEALADYIAREAGGAPRP